jgi:hypothetical protein
MCYQSVNSKESVAVELPSNNGMERLITTTVLCLLLAGDVCAGNLTLKPETLEAWDQYVRTASEAMQARLAPSHTFLWTDESPDRAGKIRKGEIVVTHMSEPMPHKVPSGLIHDWIGAAFIPDASLDEILTVVRDYPRYKENYKPVVLDSKTISLGPASQNPETDRFSVLLMNKSVILKTAIDSDYKSATYRLDGHRAYGITQSTRIQEIENYGSPEAHKLPEDQGNGLIWRLHSIARYQERDGGVYVEIEAIALSREVPFALKWMVDPIVRRISRSSLTTSIQQTKDAVRTYEALVKRSGESSARGRGQR